MPIVTKQWCMQHGKQSLLKVNKDLTWMNVHRQTDAQRHSIPIYPFDSMLWWKTIKALSSIMFKPNLSVHSSATPQHLPTFIDPPPIFNWFDPLCTLIPQHLQLLWSSLHSYPPTSSTGLILFTLSSPNIFNWFWYCLQTHTPPPPFSTDFDHICALFPNIVNWEFLVFFAL